MTLSKFAKLSKEEQIAIIKQEGSFLSIRQDCGIDIILYQIHGFYAEVYFEVSNRERFRIRSFDDTKALDVYLHEINISELQQLL